MKNAGMITIIMGRRSIRKFLERPIAVEKVQTLLECAFAAPSSKNYRPCQFVLIDDRELLKKSANPRQWPAWSAVRR